MNEVFIHAKDLHYAYKEEGEAETAVLRGLSLDIHKGEYVAILGHNGSGKSTFAKLLNMILPVFILHFGRPVCKHSSL